MSEQSAIQELADSWLVRIPEPGHNYYAEFTPEEVRLAAAKLLELEEILIDIRDDILCQPCGHARLRLAHAQIDAALNSQEVADAK